MLNQFQVLREVMDGIDVEEIAMRSAIQALRITLNKCEQQHDEDVTRVALALQDMKNVTAVLGKGIGQIATPDGFFMLWNDTEVEVSKILRELKGIDEPVS